MKNKRNASNKKSDNFIDMIFHMPSVRRIIHVVSWIMVHHFQKQ